MPVSRSRAQFNLNFKPVNVNFPLSAWRPSLAIHCQWQPWPGHGPGLGQSLRLPVQLAGSTSGDSEARRRLRVSRAAAARPGAWARRRGLAARWVKIYKGLKGFK